jgi:hypothetical protein
VLPALIGDKSLVSAHDHRVGATMEVPDMEWTHARHLTLPTYVCQGHRQTSSIKIMLESGKDKRTSHMVVSTDAFLAVGHRVISLRITCDVFSIGRPRSLQPMETVLRPVLRFKSMEGKT